MIFRPLWDFAWVATFCLKYFFAQKIFLRNLRKYLIIYPLDKNLWFGPLCHGPLHILTRSSVILQTCIATTIFSNNRQLLNNNYISKSKHIYYTIRSRKSLQRFMSSVLCNVSTIKLTDKQHCNFQVRHRTAPHPPHWPSWHRDGSWRGWGSLPGSTRVCSGQT